MAHIDCSFYSTRLKKNAHVIVFIPSTSADDYLEERKIDYYSDSRKYPTLYLLHGSYGDCTDWSIFTSIERYAQDKGIAVVMPSGENSSYVSMAYGEDYLNFVGRELPEFMRTMFPLSIKRQDTYIAGLSMGGYGAYRVGLEFPETFGYAASLSGALDMMELQTSNEAHSRKMDQNYKRAVFKDFKSISGTKDDLFFLLKTKIDARIKLPKLYMNCGTEDFIIKGNNDFFDHAVSSGVSIKYEKFPGKHDWDYWDTHIKDVLNWLPCE